MNKDNAKDYLPLIQALAKGKTIQFFIGGKWNDVEDVSFNYEVQDYRIKPEVEYVSFDTTEGKPKWHDLRKDPNDLPKEHKEYWTKWDDGAYSTAYYFGDGFGTYVIAWCELPMFEE